jgi:ABC-type Fe3+/spermidine/putrescine transport system ATPase subunit
MRPASADELRIEGVSHSYGAVEVLHDINLSVKQGDFITLLGPSGCGKTTLLRIIGGFIRPSKGRIFLNGQDLTGVPPHTRPTNTVFQRSMLFPHLTVAENVAFGLRLQKLSEEEVRKRVGKALALVRLQGFEHRQSHELSGGQMQRIALARVLILRPRVLLLDEPLSALDLAIRLEMEEELRRLHREVGAIFMYVTHDQREALALSDRIVVLNKGQIEQVGKPDEIYRSPATTFTARFVGNANVVPVKILSIENGEAVVQLATQTLKLRISKPPLSPGEASMVVRPEAIRIQPIGKVLNGGLAGVVQDFAYRGSGHAYQVAVNGIAEPLKAEMPAEAMQVFPVGAQVWISWDLHAPLLLQPGSSQNGQ